MDKEEKEGHYNAFLASGLVGHAGGVGPGLLHQLEIKIQLGFQQ